MAGFLFGTCRMIEVLNAQRCRYLAKRRLLGITHLDAATEQAPALRGCLGGALTDLAEPAFEFCCVCGCLCGEQGGNLPQSVDAFFFHFSRLAVRKFCFQAISRGASPFAAGKVCHDRLDQRIGVGPGDRPGERGASGKGLLQQSPETAGFGRGDGHPGNHRALQQQRPLFLGEARLVSH